MQRGGRTYGTNPMTVPFEQRIFDHAFHHQLKDYDANVEGTFECPICGLATVHEHTGAEIAEFRVSGRPE